MDAYLDAGAKALERYLWNGSYYFDCNEPETGRRLDAIFTPPLDGQYFAHMEGLGGVLPKSNVDTILKNNTGKGLPLSKLGLQANYMSPNGSLWTKPGEYLSREYTYEYFSIYFMR
jgi:uncharacterized protein (DUF608 family)